MTLAELRQQTADIQIMLTDAWIPMKLDGKDIDIHLSLEGNNNEGLYVDVQIKTE